MLGEQIYVDQLRRKAHEGLDEAERREMAGDLTGAAQAYRQVAVMIRQMAEKVIVADDRVRLFGKANQIDQKADLLEKGKKVAADAADRHKGVLAAEDEYKASVDELIFRSTVTWDDIGGMEELKGSLKYAMGLAIAKQPDGVRLDSPSRFLLYGPPGTGKTLLAAACSNMLGATFFNVKASDLLSKYFGESTKLISALYARARSEADVGASLIFIDEFESLCRKSSGDDSGAERRILSTFLAELDGLEEKGQVTKVITIAATNHPWDISEPVLQRFEKQFLVDLPDEKSRETIFRIHIAGKGLSLAGDVGYAILAKRTQGSSGRSIQHVCKDAVETMVRDMNRDLANRVDTRSIGDHTIKYRSLTAADFEGPLCKARPRMKQEDVLKYRTWAQECGG
ncbi:MAG: ATP-binding protein [Phycisphaerae bacterium]|nr:ATP-binding protein [Phycisphaerae bacterium]